MSAAFSFADQNLHELWQDPLGLFTTILIGIDTDEGFFVAADPVIHDPTKFFIRLEFKDRHATELQTQGWASWERDRRLTGGIEDEPVEVLVGGTKAHFLELIQFERAAKGLDQGNRQLLAERPQLFMSLTNLGEPSTALSETEESAIHPLVQELSLPADQILEVIAGARRLKMAVRGWVAERHLFDRLLSIPDITSCERLDAEGGPDLQVRYRASRPLTVECKNVLRKRDSKGLARLDFQRTRASKADPCSRYYAPTDFDVLAACLHAVTEQWDICAFRLVMA